MLSVGSACLSRQAQQYLICTKLEYICIVWCLPGAACLAWIKYFKVDTPMQIFIGKIPSRVSEKQVEEYFGQFGRVVSVSLKGTYGFLGFESDSSIDAVLNQRLHIIDGASISVERARGAKRVLDGDYHDRYMEGGRGGYMSPPRDRRYDYRYPPAYGSRSPSRYDPRFSDRYGGRSPDYHRADSFRAGGMRRDREYCEYCNGCPVHGVRDMPDPRKRAQASKDHPNNHLKVVFEGIPANTEIDDFKNFVRESGFEPTYARIGYSGTHAILEFKTIEDKDNAMKRLDGASFNGCQLKTRSYLSKDEYKSRERDTYSKNDQPSTEDMKDQQDGTDIYGGIGEDMRHEE